ncbi:MAG: ATP-binding cassette domain-containing protein [Methanothrix sp.]|nr:MAG: ATP-binding cassette domain-containing protein [Methanothrix sp.]
MRMAFLEITDLRKTARQGQSLVDILKGINLTVQRGEVLALIGPTGSGKTTLLRQIGLLDGPTGGRIIFDGVSMAGAGERALLQARRRMAMVFQKPVMFRGSVQGNVSFGLKVRGRNDGERVRSALHAVGLSGYEERDAATLSGGEMQRIALARALVLQPELLLLDEPTANLDPKSAKSIDGIIQSLASENITVIMATHNMQQCRKLADRVAVLLGGRLVKLGRPDEVFGDREVCDQMLCSSDGI